MKTKQRNDYRQSSSKDSNWRELLLNGRMTSETLLCVTTEVTEMYLELYTAIEFTLYIVHSYMHTVIHYILVYTLLYSLYNFAVSVGAS